MTLVGRQHGVVARVQLLRAGVTSNMVDHRLETGRARAFRRS